MMVKIAILSQGLIHNTKVILSRCYSAHLCTKYKLPEHACQEVYAFFLFRRSTRLSTRRFAYILTLSTAPLVSSKNSGAMVTLGGVCFSPTFSL